MLTTNDDPSPFKITHTNHYSRLILKVVQYWHTRIKMVKGHPTGCGQHGESQVSFQGQSTETFLLSQVLFLLFVSLYCS